MIGELIKGMLGEAFGKTENGQGTVYSLGSISLGGINATGVDTRDPNSSL